MAYGVTADGFEVKPYDVILDEMLTQARTVFGPDIDLSDTSPLYKYIQTIALETARLWETMEMYYYAGYPEFAYGVQLDRIYALLGLTRTPASYSTGQALFTGTNGTFIPTATVLVANDGIKFATTEDVTIAGGTATANIRATQPGADGNVAANTIQSLEIGIVGVATVNNPNPTSGGEDAESDYDFKLRAETYLATLGKGTLEAIENAIRGVGGVDTVTCIENTTTHTVVCYVTGVTPPSSYVDDAIEDTRPAGIVVTWQNPTGVNVYATATVTTTNPPTDAQTRIQDAIIAYINNLDTGEDVIFSKIIDAIYDVEETDTYSWIDDITLLLDTVTPPTGTSNIVIASTSKAQTDASKVVVTV